MKLKTVEVCGFRSISNAKMQECGGFNVLIGKNNAGKSNLLLAIDAFLSTVKKGQVASLGSKYLEEGYFALSDERADEYRLNVTFSVSDLEMNGIVEDICSDAPQVATAAEALRSTSDITVCVVFDRNLSGPYIQSIVAHLPSETRTLLNVKRESAQTLLHVLSTVQTLQEEEEFFADLPSRLERETPFEILKQDMSVLDRNLYFHRRRSPAIAGWSRDYHESKTLFARSG